MSVHQLILGHNDMALVLHKTRNIGKDFMEHKNSIKQKILVIEAFCRTVDMHSQKLWISGKIEHEGCQHVVQAAYNTTQSQIVTCN